MATNLPYFKFYSSEWNDGDITLESFQTQGVFINICSLYWSRECSLTLDKLIRRFPNSENDIMLLIKENLIKNLDDGTIKIRFLDEQYKGRDGRSSTSKTNGAKGGRPKKPKEPNITQLREEEIRREEIRREEEEKKRKKAAAKRFKEPTLKEVADYCLERKNEVNPDSWMNHYAAKGWMIGPNKMKDWKAAVRTWEKNDTKKDVKNWNPFS